MGLGAHKHVTLEEHGVSFLLENYADLCDSRFRNGGNGRRSGRVNIGMRAPFELTPREGERHVHLSARRHTP